MHGVPERVPGFIRHGRPVRLCHAVDQEIVAGPPPPGARPRRRAVRSADGNPLRRPARYDDHRAFGIGNAQLLQSMDLHGARIRRPGVCSSRAPRSLVIGPSKARSFDISDPVGADEIAGELKIVMRARDVGTRQHGPAVREIAVHDEVRSAGGVPVDLRERKRLFAAQIGLLDAIAIEHVRVQTVIDGRNGLHVQPDRPGQVQRQPPQKGPDQPGAFPPTPLFDEVRAGSQMLDEVLVVIEQPFRFGGLDEIAGFIESFIVDVVERAVLARMKMPDHPSGDIRAA